MKKKSIIPRVLLWVLLAAAIAGVVYIGYLLWGKPESEPLYTAEIYRYDDEEEKPIILDNGKLHLELNPATTQFVLTDSYGHEWKSNPFEDPASSGETIATGENKNALASPLNVYFRLPKKAVDNMYDAYTYSVSRSAYRIEKTSDVSARVTYSLGDIAREFVIPESLTKDRYTELTDAVKASGTSKKQFTGKFSAKKTASMMKDLTGEDSKKKEEAAGLLSTYPVSAVQDVYLISIDGNDNFGALEKLMQKIGYSEEDRQLDIILSRSSYQYTYHKYTPEEITALQGGTAEEKELAGRLLEKQPELNEKAFWILQRSGRVITPENIEALLEGTESQAEYANQLIAAYPDIQTDPATIISLGENESETLFTTAELTDENLCNEVDQLLEKGVFEASEKPVDILFDVTVCYRLDGDDFIAEVPYSEMKFNSNAASLSYISILPMFGAVGAQEDGTYEEGWLLVPEGGGALIRFNNQKLKQTAYYADVYGYDYGIKRDEFITESKAQFPVFGILRKNQSFFCVVEEGSSFVSIRADVNGNAAGTERSSYNYANAKAQVLHIDQYNVSEKTPELQLMYEKQIPDVTLTQRYRFTDSADYIQLAASYGDYLREHYSELKDKQSSEEIPVSVELIGAIDKRVVTAGVPVRKVVPTTTFTQGQEIIDSLLGNGVTNISARYTGWLKGGIRQKVLTGVHVLNELGGESGAKALIRHAKDNDTALYFDGMTAFAYDSGLTDGFLAVRDAARHITRETAEIHYYDPICYYEDNDRDPFWLVHPDYAKENASRLIRWIKENEGEGITFRDIGIMLSADYDPDRVTTREQVKNLNIETLKEARNTGLKNMVKEGFDFALPYADLITDMDLSGIRYVLIDRYIPFYQTAIHGMVDYTGRALNMQGDYQTELLRSVEYGAGLNYSFTAENASVTQETEYTGLYGTSFESWETEAAETIRRYQQEGKGLNRLRITGHEELSEFVRVTTYEDGTKVYVNYGTEEYNKEIRIPARDYLIVGKEGM